MQKTNRVRLRPIVMEDAEQITKFLSGQNIGNLQFFQSPVTIERQRMYLQEKLTSGTDHLFVIVHIASGRMIGTMGLHEHDIHNHNARIGKLILRHEDRQNGFAGEAEEILLGIGFGEFGLHKIYARILLGNEMGKIHYRAIGFKEEGRMREEYFLDGNYHDMLLLSILKSEWLSCQKT